MPKKTTKPEVTPEIVVDAKKAKITKKKDDVIAIQNDEE
jgi:hypothetical protein